VAGGKALFNALTVACKDDAQPFNQPDMPRQAGSCRLFQTLGITVDSTLQAMHSPFSASFHSSESAKYLARLPLALSWFRASFAGSFFTLSSLGFPCSLRLAAPAVRVASFSVSSWLALRAAVLRLATSPLVLSFSPVLLLSSHARPCKPKSRLSLVRFCRVVFCLRQRRRTSVTAVPCQLAMPNPSIERTNNGGSQLRSFANAQPPLFASHLKR
jgi:hypothetical protein